MGNFFSRSRHVQVDEEAVRAAEATLHAHQGLYFGPHFIMGGQRFATSGAPDTFLFGGLTADAAALSTFGMNKIPHPLPDLEATTTVKSFVNLKKSSLHLIHHPEHRNQHGIEFFFDAEKDCVISVYLACKEEMERNSTAFTCLHGNSSFSKEFSKGMNQKFSLPPEAYFDFSKFPQEELMEDDMNHPEGVNSLVVLMEVLDQAEAEEERKNIQSQSTFATLVRNSDQAFELRVTKQRITADGISYVLQEIFGMELPSDQSQGATAEEILENTRECVVCMADPKDTIALPCRHMCLCSHCAEQLRFQSNKCPICRQPFHSLLQIKLGPEQDEEENDQEGMTGETCSEVVVVSNQETGQQTRDDEEDEDEEAQGSPPVVQAKAPSIPQAPQIDHSPESSVPVRIVKKERKSRKESADDKRDEVGDEDSPNVEGEIAKKAKKTAKKAKKKKVRLQLGGGGGEEGSTGLKTRRPKKLEAVSSSETPESLYLGLEGEFSEERGKFSGGVRTENSTEPILE